MYVREVRKFLFIKKSQIGKILVISFGFARLNPKIPFKCHVITYDSDQNRTLQINFGKLCDNQPLSIDTSLNESIQNLS